MRPLLAALAISVAGCATVPRIGEPARRLEAPTHSGEAFRLESLRGKVVVLDFFATWCQYCRPVSATLDQLARKHPESFELVIVDVDDDRNVVDAFFREHKAPPNEHILIDDTQAMKAEWAATVPMVVILDANGIVRNIHVGVSEESRRQLGSEIASAMLPISARAQASR